MGILNHKMASLFISTVTAESIPRRLLYLALPPVLIFIVVYFICSFNKKKQSKSNGFDTALIAGYFFLFSCICVGVDMSVLGSYWDNFLISVFLACAFGLSLLCFRLRPDFKCQKTRSILMYSLISITVTLLIFQYVTLFK